MDYLLEFSFKPKLTTKQRKSVGVKTVNDLNGLYYYTYDGSVPTVCVNLRSPDFKYTTDDYKIKLVTEVISHELLHHEIHKITNMFATDKEEEIIKKITR